MIGFPTSSRHVPPGSPEPGRYPDPIAAVLVPTSRAAVVKPVARPAARPVPLAPTTLPPLPEPLPELGVPPGASTSARILRDRDGRMTGVELPLAPRPLAPGVLRFVSKEIVRDARGRIARLDHTETAVNPEAVWDETSARLIAAHGAALSGARMTVTIGSPTLTAAQNLELVEAVEAVAQRDARFWTLTRLGHLTLAPGASREPAPPMSLDESVAAAARDVADQLLAQPYAPGPVTATVHTPLPPGARPEDADAVHERLLAQIAALLFEPPRRARVKARGWTTVDVDLQFDGLATAGLPRRIWPSSREPDAALIPAGARSSAPTAEEQAEWTAAVQRFEADRGYRVPPLRLVWFATDDPTCRTAGETSHLVPDLVISLRVGRPLEELRYTAQHELEHADLFHRNIFLSKAEHEGRANAGALRLLRPPATGSAPDPALPDRDVIPADARLAEPSAVDRQMWAMAQKIYAAREAWPRARELSPVWYDWADREGTQVGVTIHDRAGCARIALLRGRPGMDVFRTALHELRHAAQFETALGAQLDAQPERVNAEGRLYDWREHDAHAWADRVAPEYAGAIHAIERKHGGLTRGEPRPR